MTIRHPECICHYYHVEAAFVLRVLQKLRGIFAPTIPQQSRRLLMGYVFLDILDNGVVWVVRDHHF